MSAQPKLNSRGQIIEELDDYRPLFMSPKPVSPKRKVSSDKNIVSILGKRKFNDAFNATTFDDSRYGQHIDIDFFNKNVGHSVSQKLSYEKVIERKDNVKIYSYQEELDILQWCQNYLASKSK
jgi:hypothetical protein